MADTDEQIIQGFLNSFPLTEAAEKASAALDRILARTLPKLPDGWQFYLMMGSSQKIRCDMQYFDRSRFVSGEGPTPRAAVLQAIAKIVKQPTVAETAT